MAARIKRGDFVRVIAGSSKGAEGEVLQVLPSNNRAVVKSVNIATIHKRAQRVGEESGIFTREAPIHLSNLKLIDPKSKKPTRVGFRTLEDGNKVRFAKITGQNIEA